MWVNARTKIHQLASTPSQIENQPLRKFIGVQLDAPASTSKRNPSVLRDDAVDDSVVLCLFRAHEVIALGVLADLVQILASVVRDDLVETPADVDDLLGVDLDVGGLTLEAEDT